MVQTIFRKKFVAQPSKELLYVNMPDGRKISYQEYGDPNGLPVFYFHGTPSSSNEASLLDSDFKAFELRLIAPNRPGINGSDFVNTRQFSWWAADVASLADHLKIGTFSLLGFSGGAPYVAACAATFPERISSALIISGAWKMNVKEAQQHIYESVRLFWKVAAKVPFLIPFIIKGMRTKHDEVTAEEIELWKNRTTEADFNFLKENNRIAILKKSVNQAITNIKGVTWDVLMYVRKWDILLDKIQFPITILHGLQDRNVPVALVEKMVSSIPNTTLKLYENEGHYSILGNQMADVIFALTGKEAILPTPVEISLKVEDMSTTDIKTEVLPGNQQA